MRGCTASHSIPSARAGEWRTLWPLKPARPASTGRGGAGWAGLQDSDGDKPPIRRRAELGAEHALALMPGGEGGGN